MDSDGLGLGWTDRLTGSDRRKLDQRGLRLRLAWTRARSVVEGFQGTRMHLELLVAGIWTCADSWTCVDPLTGTDKNRTSVDSGEEWRQRKILDSDGLGLGWTGRLAGSDSRKSNQHTWTQTWTRLEQTSRVFEGFQWTQKGIHQVTRN